MENRPIMTKEEYEKEKLILENKIITLSVKRLFDIIMSLLLIISFFPIIIIISLLVMIDSGFPVFFRQNRIGLKGKIFSIFKFRTMKKNTATSDGITLKNDNRITKIGKFLRRYRLDEIPQLFNVIRGEMSFVGPRPDLPKYYQNNDYAYHFVLLVRPGITSEATLKFKDEDELLSKSENAEKMYSDEIFPMKIKLNVNYITNINVVKDISVLIKTLIRVIK